MADPIARRALLIDFGGVLTTNLFDSFAAFCRAEGLGEDAVRAHFRHAGEGHDLLVEMECGRMPIPEFEQRFARVLGVAPEDLVARLFAGLRPDEAMYGAVQAAHDAQIRTALISNSWGTEGYDHDRFERMFDALVISGEIGARKPAPELYETAVRRLGVTAAECVFVDDLGGNLKPARAMGMATVKHVRAEETIAALEDLLGVMLRAACPGSSS